jgi:predicted membrane chloride channel (bestrophin family)
MTVSYSDSVATAEPWTFLKLLMRWRGSVLKLLWKDLLFFVVIFYFIHFIYLSLPEEGEKNFEAFVRYCSEFSNAIPLSFVLGFFVTAVMTRWWSQFEAIPYPASIAVFISSTLHGYDEVGRAMRRTIMRYVCLSLTLVFRKLSTRVQNRFPKFKDLVISGLMHDGEVEVIEELEAKFPGYSKNWLPIVWASSVVSKARREGRIKDDMTVNAIIEALNDFRSKCNVLLYYNTITIPLVYTQVVCIAVYTYFFAALFSHQFIKSSKSSYYVGSFNLDVHPILLSLQFIFYMGWLKVAEALLNPFGTDDDDFDGGLFLGVLITS